MEYLEPAGARVEKPLGVRTEYSLVSKVLSSTSVVDLPDLDIGQERIVEEPDYHIQLAELQIERSC